MAESHTSSQTRHSHRAANQPPVADGQTPGGAEAPADGGDNRIASLSSQLKGLAANVGKNTSPEGKSQPAQVGDGTSAPANPDSPASASGGEDDWGITPPSSGVSRETKLGFAFVFVLLVVFGFVVYKKIERNRAERGDLLAGVQSEEQESKPQESPVQPTNTAQNPISQSAPPPAQPDDPFAMSQSVAQQEPVEMSQASWDNQSFEPVPEQQQTAGTSVDAFPPAAPEEFGTAGQMPESQPFPAQQEPQTSVAASTPQPEPATAVEEFNPAPVPEPEVAETPLPQGFEPPEEFGNPAQVPTQQATAAEPPVEQADPNFNPFGNAGTTAQAQPEPAPANLENEQFSTQSQPQSQEVVQQQPVPAAEVGNPFGGELPAQSAAPEAQPIPQELPTAQAAPGPMGSDPFGTAPAEIASTNSVPMPAEVAVENDPRFGDFQPAPVANQYEAEPRSVPNELPSDVFAQMSSSQIATSGTTGYGQMQPGDQPQVYTVRPGDNYWHISKKQYGTVRYFMALARYNQERIPDPKRMQPGMKVLTPNRDVLESRNPDLFPRFAAKTSGVHNVAHQGAEKAGFFVEANGTPMYRVGPDDTLGGIAQKHLGRFSRWVEIYQMNRHRLKDPNALSLGDVLELPADASRVSMVRHASGIR